MKILQTPPRISTHGGVERYVCDLSRQLVKMKNRVTILCSGTIKDEKSDDDLIIKPLTSLGNVGNTTVTPTLPIELWRGE